MFVTNTHTHRHTLSLIHTRSLSFTHTLSFNHTHTHRHTLTLSFTHTLSLIHTHTLSLNPTYTHTYTHMRRGERERYNVSLCQKGRKRKFSYPEKKSHRNCFNQRQSTATAIMWWVWPSLGQFHQHSMSSFYARWHQKRKKRLSSWAAFFAFWICKCKSCI